MSTSPIMYNIGIDPIYAKTKNKNFNKEINQLSVQLENLEYQNKDSFLKKINECIQKIIKGIYRLKGTLPFLKEKCKNLSILNKGRQFGYVEKVVRTKRFK